MTFQSSAYSPSTDARDYKISTQVLTISNTEYAVALENNLKQLLIKSRSPAILKIASVSGEIALGIYWTIPVNCAQTLEGIFFNDKILYIESNEASTTIELIQLYN